MRRGSFAARKFLIFLAPLLLFISRLNKPDSRSTFFRCFLFCSAEKPSHCAKLKFLPEIKQFSSR